LLIQVAMIILTSRSPPSCSSRVSLIRVELGPCRNTPRHIEDAYIIPSWSRAASDILLGSQGGSHTRSSFTSVTPETALTLFSISAGKDCTAGQCGDVSVILIDTTPASSAFISYTSPNS